MCKPFGIKRNTWCQLCSLSPGSKESKSSHFIPNTIKKPPVSSPVFWVWNDRRWVWSDIWKDAEALILLDLSVETVENKRTQAFWPESWKVVEMMGIEPMSESISDRISPSAASVLKLRLRRRPEAGFLVGYPVSPSCCRAFTWSFPACSMPDIRPAGEPKLTRTAYNCLRSHSHRCEIIVLFSVYI